jgi:uncharacterized phage protein (TIGR02218 family)
MRRIDEGMAAQLASETTTLCRCWRVRRRDGVEMGFTDHDATVRFMGLDHEPGTGFQSSEIETALGLSVDNLEAAGALSSDRIREEDVVAGLWDGAEIEHWLVDWRRPSRRLKLFAGHAGEIRRGGVGFEMEVLGVSAALNRPIGRSFQRLCDAEVGDARCGADLDGGPYRRSGAVARLLDTRRFEVSGMDGRPDGWFSLGRLEWTSGANAGRTASVRAHRAGAATVFELWHAPESAISVGDGVRMFAGCDKSAETCRAKFGNLENFRGFPLMPGEDWLAARPREDEAHDGGSLFR